MSRKTDEVKGRIKEAAGALTDNDKLREEGKTDQAIGKIKQVAEKAVAKVKQGQAAQQQDHGNHEEVPKHGTADDHSQDADRHSKTRHVHSQK
jgi:uncharacterized protein YjbJ (UPF0337 family)